MSGGSYPTGTYTAELLVNGQWTGTVEATVFQKTVNYPDEYHHGFHVTLDDGTWVTVRREQVERN